MLTSILFVINRWSFFMSLFLGVLSAAVTNKLAGLENSSKAEIPNKKLLSETNQTGVLPNFFKKRFCFALRAISRLAVVAHSVEYTVHLVRRSLGEGGSLMSLLAKRDLASHCFAKRPLCVLTLAGCLPLQGLRPRTPFFTLHYGQSLVKLSDTGSVTYIVCSLAVASVLHRPCRILLCKK